MTDSLLPEPLPRPSAPVRDRSGYRMFSAGDCGEAHALAHEMLDLGRPHEGHARLGAWLDGRTGSGCRWVHLHWHMLVFELAVGDRGAAARRFRRAVLPAVRVGHEALVDAPSGLWRIALAGSEPLDLPWQEVADRAADALPDADDPYTVLHCLLALAGVGDAAGIDAYLARHDGVGPGGQALERMAMALRALASGNRATALPAFALALPGLASIGGSHAQNELFVELSGAVVA
ncbi:MAG: hypothetical protein ACFCGT_04295 [Sandaracinaceae bacterium]